MSEERGTVRGVQYRVREEETLMVQNILKFMTECQAVTSTSTTPCCVSQKTQTKTLHCINKVRLQ